VALWQNACLPSTSPCVWSLVVAGREREREIMSHSQLQRKYFSFFSIIMMLVTAFSYMVFVMLRPTPVSSGLVSWRDIEFC
jgi:hypothetical protein